MQTPQDNNETYEKLDFDQISLQKDLNSEISWGKYNGRKIKDIPEDYIVWYTKNFNDNGFNNRLRRIGWKIMKRHESERKNATAVPVEFQDERYQYGNQKTVFYLSQELMERALNGIYRLTDIDAYSVSFKVPNHMFLAGGVTPSFRFDLFLQLSMTGYTLMLINHDKKEMYVSKKQKFEL